jgi:hypothetical protein
LSIAERVGNDQALVEQYGIGSVRELHNDWVSHRSTSRDVGVVTGKQSVSLVSAGGRPPGRPSVRAGDSSLGAN